MRREGKSKAVISVAAAFVVLLGLAAVWRWTALQEYLDFRIVARALGSLRSQPLAPYIVVLVFLIGSQLMFPITVLILATTYTFGPWLGFVYAMLGSILGALLTYGIGYFMGHETFKRLAGRHYEHLDQRFKKNGLLAVITTHLLPIGPFTIVNLGAGVIHVRLWHFVVGCMLGMLPGMALITIFAQQLERSMREPGVKTAAVLAAFAVAVAAWLFWTRRRARLSV